MGINNLTINPGAPVKSSIPLVANKFGRGFGLNNPSTTTQKDDKEVLVELSRSASKYSNKLQAANNAQIFSVSDSPLNQALDAISDISKKISVLQEKYSKATSGTSQSESIASELNSLAKEYIKITESNLFKTDNSNSSLEFSDSLVKSTLDSGNQDRITALTDGLKGLSSVSFDEILTDKTISKKIQDFVNTIKGALNPENDKSTSGQVSEGQGNSIIIAAPEAKIKTIGQAEGLSVSLLSYSNEDLIKAAAAHMDIDSTNVLLLTYNAPEPKEETEQEKEEREKNSDKIEIQNPTELPTLADKSGSLSL